MEPNPTTDSFLNFLPCVQVTFYGGKCPVHFISIGKVYKPNQRALKVRPTETSKSLCRSLNLPNGSARPLWGCPGASPLHPRFVILDCGGQEGRGASGTHCPCPAFSTEGLRLSFSESAGGILAQRLLCAFLVMTFRLSKPLIYKRE